MKKIILIIVSLLSVMVLGIGLAGSIWFNNSPYKTGLDISRALIDEDAQTLQSFVDCESFKQNFVTDAFVTEDCDTLNIFESNESGSSFFDDVKTDNLPSQSWEVFTSERFESDGDSYSLRVDALVEGAEVEYTVILQQIDDQWRIVDLDLGLLEQTIQDLEKAFQEDFRVGEEVCEVVKDAEGNITSQICRCVGCADE